MAGAAVITVAAERTVQPSPARNLSMVLLPASPAGYASEIVAGRPRAAYQRQTSATASASGRPGSPIASALFARPVKPPAARSSQRPSLASSGARQPPAAASSRSQIEMSTP